MFDLVQSKGQHLRVLVCMWGTCLCMSLVVVTYTEYIRICGICLLYVYTCIFKYVKRCLDTSHIHKIDSVPLGIPIG